MYRVVWKSPIANNNLRVKMLRFIANQVGRKHPRTTLNDFKIEYKKNQIIIKRKGR